MITDEQLGRMYDAAAAITVEGTRMPESGRFIAPFYIIDASTAEWEVNWPGELMEVAASHSEISGKLRSARVKVMRRVLKGTTHGD